MELVLVTARKQANITNVITTIASEATMMSIVKIIHSNGLRDHERAESVGHGQQAKHYHHHCLRGHDE